MSRIDKHAAFYRGYLTDDRSLAPVTAVLVTAIAIWLLFYLVSLVGPAPPPAREAVGISRPAGELVQRGLPDGR